MKVALFLDKARQQKEKEKNCAQEKDLALRKSALRIKIVLQDPNAILKVYIVEVRAMCQFNFQGNIHIR